MPPTVHAPETGNKQARTIPGSEGGGSSTMAAFDEFSSDLGQVIESESEQMPEGGGGKNTPEKKVQRSKALSKPQALSKTQAMVLWRARKEDNVIVFPKLQSDACFYDLQWLLQTFTDSFTPGIVAKGRDRIMLECLFAVLFNDNARTTQEALGKARHSWALQTLHEGYLGQPASEALDLPFFFALLPWKPLQKYEYEQYTPMQRLRVSSILQPWLWNSSAVETLRIRVLLPTTRLEGKIHRFEFKLLDAEPDSSTILRKTIILLWIEGMLVFTTAGEMLDCDHRPTAAGSSAPPTRRQLTRHMDSFSEYKQHGPFLIQNSFDAVTRLRRIDWLVIARSADSQVWLQSRRVSASGISTLHKALYDRLVAELQPGNSLGVEWGTYFDMFLPGH